MLERTAFRKYIRDCRALYREITDVLSDLDFRENGGTIIYAIDFSEIYAYVKPHETAKHFTLFADDDDLLNEPMQSLALKHLFFDTQHEITLLKPYAAELQSFIYFSQAEEDDALLESLGLVTSDQSDVLCNPAFVEVEQMVERVVQEQRKFSNEERERLTQFYESADTAKLLAFIGMSQEERPLARLRGMFEKRRYFDLSGILPKRLYLADHAYVDEIFRQLRQLRTSRPEGSSRLDAIAVGLVVAANRILEKSNIRVQLVSRSPAMHALRRFSKFGILNNYIRHPRIFGVTYTTRTPNPSDLTTHLRNQLATLRLLFSSIDVARRGSLPRFPNSTFIRRLVTEIRDDWRTTHSLALSLASSTDVSANDWTHQPAVVQRLFTLLRDRGELRSAIVERIGEVQNSIHRDNQVFGVYFATISNPDRDSIAEHFLADSSPGRKTAILKTSLQAMPYTLEFYTPDAKRLLSRLDTSARAIRLDRLLMLFREVLSAEAEYERLLAMAFILGTLNRWPLAEQYGRMAVKLPSIANTSKHEAHFFLAICLRKSKTSAERIRSGLENLECATELKRQFVGDNNHIDPRYLKEKATQILHLHRYFPESSEEANALEDPLDLLSQAEKLADPNLRMQILNNRIDHLLRITPGDVSHLEPDYVQLRLLLSQIESDQRNWPPSILDTMAWARYRIYGVRNPNEVLDIVKMLRIASENEELAPFQREVVKEHLREVLATWGTMLQEKRNANLPVAEDE